MYLSKKKTLHTLFRDHICLKEGGDDQYLSNDKRHCQSRSTIWHNDRFWHLTSHPPRSDVPEVLSRLARQAAGSAHHCMFGLIAFYFTVCAWSKRDGRSAKWLRCASVSSDQSLHISHDLRCTLVPVPTYKSIPLSFLLVHAVAFQVSSLFSDEIIWWWHRTVLA